MLSSIQITESFVWKTYINQEFPRVILLHRTLTVQEALKVSKNCNSLIHSIQIVASKQLLQWALDFNETKFSHQTHFFPPFKLAMCSIPITFTFLCQISKKAGRFVMVKTSLPPFYLQLQETNTFVAPSHTNPCSRVVRAAAAATKEQL